MKQKTSITLSSELLKEIDRIIQSSGNRSAFIEQAIWDYLKHLNNQLRDKNDLKLINKNSKHLNEEAKDVLNYQVEL